MNLKKKERTTEAITRTYVFGSTSGIFKEPKNIAVFVMANATKKKDGVHHKVIHLIFQAQLFYILLEVRVLILRQLF